MVFQMKVRTISCIKRKGAWGNTEYLTYFQATNPYTGKIYTAWDNDAAWSENKDEEEEEIDDWDDWQASNVSWRRCQEAQYWCNS